MAFRFRTIVEDYEAKLQPVDSIRAGVNAGGKAEWERFGNGEEEFDVRVRKVELQDDSTLDVYLEQQFVGQIIVRKKQGRLRIESRNGGIIPAVAARKKISVRIDGSVVLEGIFIED